MESGFVLKEASIEVGIVDCGVSAHGTAPSLPLQGVSKLKDVASHDFGQAFE